VRRLLAVAGCLAVLVGSALVSGGIAQTAGSPFYLVPPQPRQECNGVKQCISQIGPWVVVTPGAESTFLLVCPQKSGLFGGTVAGARHGYVGGTDTRASSPKIQVWFDGQIGSPIMQSVTTGGSLLFHAITANGKPGTFEPVIGCIRLTQRTNGRSTVSARRAAAVPGTNAGVPLDLQARNLVLVAGTAQSVSVSCPKGEKVVDSWKALAFATEDPPALRHLGDVTAKLSVTARKVSVAVSTAQSLPFVPLAEIQVGAACAT
jgi:hypothetical protein